MRLILGWLINIYYVSKELEGNHIAFICCAHLQGLLGVGLAGMPLQLRLMLVGDQRLPLLLVSLVSSRR